MIEYTKLYEIVESKLSDKRFNHTLRVIDRAIEYAKVYKIDEEQVKLVALAHDIAKEQEEGEVKQYFQQLDKIEIINKNLQHAKIGAIICEQYGFEEDMINAIKYHTTGRANMSLLEKIIYLADATESSREVGKTYVELVKEDIDKAMLELCSWTLKKLLNQNQVIHEDSIKCYNYYNILTNRESKNQGYCNTYN